MTQNYKSLINSFIKSFVFLLFLFAVHYSVANSNYLFFRKSNIQLNINTVVSGVVLEINSQGVKVPVSGAVIREKGTKNGTITNDVGEFKLEVNENALLVFSAIGYVSQELSTKGRSKFEIILENDAKSLDEVVVTGYQKMNRGLFTGASVKLKADDIKTAGVTEVGRMLEGRAAGVSVQNVSGTFGAAPKIRVRGATSISGENKPLWVIDGVILEDVLNISNDDLSSGNASTLLGSSVAGINADDIESFQVLKDASATALYGGRAMNGVVVITTKRGKNQKPTMSYSTNMSVSLKPNYSEFNIMNSADQMEVYKEMYQKGWLRHSQTATKANSGIYGKMYDLINTYDPETKKFGLENTDEAKNNFLKRYSSINTDWFDNLFRNSLLQDHSLSFNSGNEYGQYYFSTSFLNDQGRTIADKVNRYTANFRSNFNLNSKLSITFGMTASLRKQKVPGSKDRQDNPIEGKYERDFDINPFSYALNASRTMAIHDENGNLEFYKQNYAPFNFLHETQHNFIELNQLDAKFQPEIKYTINDNFALDITALARTVLTTTEHKIFENSNLAGAYRAAENKNIADNNKFLFTDPEFPDNTPISVLPYGGMYNTKENKLTNYYGRLMLNWNNGDDTKHIMKALIGSEIKYSDRQESFTNGFGYQFDKGGMPFTDYRAIQKDLLTNFQYFGVENTRDRAVAAFLNTTYSFQKRFTFNGTFRMDGSNQLGKSSRARWLPTWNVSGSWNVKEESFFKDNKTFNALSFRATYGLTASIGDAQNSTAILKNRIPNRQFDDEKESSIFVEDLENNELTWEKQYETNIGFDMGIFQNKYNLSVDMYQRNGFDLINEIRTSGVGGEYFKKANVADMRSRGIDITFGANIINQTNFKWKTSVVFGYFSNTITKLKNFPIINDLVKNEGGPQLGRPVRGLYSVESNGLNEFGVPIFKNETGEVSPTIDLQAQVTKYLKYEGSVDPLATGGFSNTFSYKNLSLSLFFSYQGGNKIRLDPAFSDEYNDINAMPYEFLNRWILPKDELKTNIPVILDARMEEGFPGDMLPYQAYNISNIRVANGDFVRFKSISFSYRATGKVLKKMGFKSMSVTATGTNLLLLFADKKLNGQDPEFFGSGGVALPQPKQVSMSISLTL